MISLPKKRQLLQSGYIIYFPFILIVDDLKVDSERQF